MIAITKSWPLFTIFIVIFAFSFSFIGSEFQSLVITVPESWIEFWYFAITFPFIKSESQSLVITIPESGTESWYLVITFSFINPEYRSLVILHFFFRPLWKSAVFRAGNVVGVGCHIFPLRLQIAVSCTLFKCPILTAWIKLTGLLAIKCRFLGIFFTKDNVVFKICSVIFKTRLFSCRHFYGHFNGHFYGHFYGHFFGWKPRIW